MPDLSDALTAAAGALAGTWFGYIIWIRQRTAEFRFTRDASLRDLRLTAYRKLWRNLELLALYAPPVDVTVGRLAQLEARLRRWYFEHGILLSSRARDLFFMLQESIDLIRLPSELYSAEVASNDTLRCDRPSSSATEAEGKGLWIVRPRGCVIPTERLGDWQQELGLVPLDDKALRKPILFAAWCRETKRTVRQWRFRQPVSEIVAPDFVLFQFIASQLRTVLTADLSSRSTAVVDRDIV